MKLYFLLSVTTFDLKCSAAKHGGGPADSWINVCYILPDQATYSASAAPAWHDVRTHAITVFHMNLNLPSKSPRSATDLHTTSG